MALLSTQNISHAFGGPLLLDGVAIQIEKGDRVCLFGRNGEGKSTLLKILSKQLIPDEGSVDLSSGATLATLEQNVPGAHEATVFEVVTSSMGKVSDAISRYEKMLALITVDPCEANLEKFAKSQAAMDANDAWALQTRVSNILTRLDLDPNIEFASLSGGWRRRAYLARALAMEPDVLLLDEPTNHLDIDAIRWLESYLLGFKGALIFVTHDRVFLENIATRILEIDRGQVVEYPSSFEKYLEAKETALDVEEKHNALFDKKLAKEEEWIRTGIKARRTRNEGRVRALKRLRQTRKRRRNRKKNVELKVQKTGRTGEIVFEAENLSFAYGENKIVEDINIRIVRGERIGLIGPNGVGKTTLLNLLLEDLKPDSGSVKHGTKLEVAYYDQLRSQLDLDLTLIQTLSPNSDHVVVGGEAMHVLSYFRNFLFDADQARGPVRVLSGGERNRLLLAKLFLLPSNVLVLDEPTNDLDMETLNVLEDFLHNYDGTVLMVSHDRAFLDNLATRSFVFMGNGEVELIEGGFSEAIAILDREAKSHGEKEIPVVEKKKEVKAPKKVEPEKKKLSYKDQRELDALPALIETLETRQNELQLEMSKPDVYSNPEMVKKLTIESDQIDEDLMEAFERWEILG